MTLPPKAQPKWPLWILGATFLILLGLALIYGLNADGLSPMPGTTVH